MCNARSFSIFDKCAVVGKDTDIYVPLVVGVKLEERDRENTKLCLIYIFAFVE